MARQQDEVTSGIELNSYTGNKNLGTGAADGYAKADLSPLAVYAANVFKTHQTEYEQQQKDKAKLEEMYNDPKIYLQLDRNYADQLTPLTKKLLDLGKENLEMDPKGDKYYEFMDAHNQLVGDNAKLKVVQDKKNDALKRIEASADPHEKERLNQYVGQLDKYKLGEEIPLENTYFKYNDAHMPAAEVTTGTRQIVLPNGNVATQKYTVTNANGLDEKAARNLVTNPEAAQTYSDIAHTFLQSGDIGYVNDALPDTYLKNQTINASKLQTTYKSEFADYQKTNPSGTFEDFMNYTGRGTELAKMQKDNAYLNQKVQEVTPPADENLSTYTYYIDPKTGQRKRFNVPDSTLAAMVTATKTIPGQKDEVVDEKLGLTPKDKFEADERLKLERENNAQKEKENQREDATKRYIAGLSDTTQRYIAGLKDYSDGKTTKTPELPITPMPSILAGIGGYNTRVKVSSLPISQIAAINPSWLDAKGVFDAKKYGNIEVSVGKLKDQDQIFVYDRKENKKYQVNESKLKSNGENWLATFAKERKGQEVYGYVEALLGDAKNTNPLAAGSPASPAAPASAPAQAAGGTQTRKGKDGKVYSSSDGLTWTAPDGTTVTLKKK